MHDGSAPLSSTFHRPTSARRPNQSCFVLPSASPDAAPHVLTHRVQDTDAVPKRLWPVRLTEALLRPPCPLALRELDGILGAFSCERATMRPQAQGKGIDYLTGRMKGLQASFGIE